MKTSAAALAFMLSPLSALAGVEQECADQIAAQAARLVEFHMGEEPGTGIVSVPGPFKSLSPVRNPANPRQSFQVVEAWAYVYKAEYRVRLLYAEIPGAPCVLMGQEVLSHAKL